MENKGKEIKTKQKLGKDFKRKGHGGQGKVEDLKSTRVFQAQR